MTTDIILVFSILAVSVLFLVTEWVPMEVTALLVLGSVATTGLVKPLDALSGFGNPAVVTVWAVFILSGGLTRTGVANVIGRLVLKLSGSSQTLMVTVIMVCAGVLSAVMNNVAVAALMLPVVMDIARQTGRSPSCLLMPLAYGSLLGGLTTQIGTPPNILVSEALRENGMVPFTLFDFTPVGLAVMAAGVAFMAFVGIKFLPEKAPGRQTGPSDDIDLGKQYQLSERMFRLRIPEGSALEGKTLAQSRIGTVLGLNVVGITRPGATLLAPGPGEMLRESDELTVEGPAGQIRELAEELARWSELDVQHSDMSALKELVSENIHIVEASVPEGSFFSGRTIGGNGLPYPFRGHRSRGFAKRTRIQVAAAGSQAAIRRCHAAARRNRGFGDIGPVRAGCSRRTDVPGRKRDALPSCGKTVGHARARTFQARGKEPSA